MSATLISGPLCAVCHSRDGEPALGGWRCVCGRLTLVPESAPEPAARTIEDTIKSGTTTELVTLASHPRHHAYRDLAIRELRRRRCLRIA
jgi:hypothetical protein